MLGKWEAGQGELKSGAWGPTSSSSSDSSKGNHAPQGSPWFLQSLTPSPAPALTPETKDGSAPDRLRTGHCQHLGQSVAGGSTGLTAAPHSQVWGMPGWGQSSQPGQVLGPSMATGSATSTVGARSSAGPAKVDDLLVGPGAVALGRGAGLSPPLPTSLGHLCTEASCLLEVSSIYGLLRWGPQGLPSSCPSQGGLGGQPWPSPPQRALLMGQASPRPICLQDGSQDKAGKDTGPAEAIKTTRPHKSPGMESVSGAAAALIKHSSDHMFPSSSTTTPPPHPVKVRSSQARPALFSGMLTCSRGGWAEGVWMGCHSSPPVCIPLGGGLEVRCGQKNPGGCHLLPHPPRPHLRPGIKWGPPNLGLGKVPSFPPSAEVTVHPSLRPTQRWPQFHLPGPGVFRLCSWEARGVMGPGMS